MYRIISTYVYVLACAREENIPLILQIAYLHQPSTRMVAAMNVGDDRNQLYVDDSLKHAEKMQHLNEHSSEQQDNTMDIQETLGSKYMPNSKTKYSRVDLVKGNKKLAPMRAPDTYNKQTQHDIVLIIPCLPRGTFQKHACREALSEPCLPRGTFGTMPAERHFSGCETQSKWLKRRNA